MNETDARPDVDEIQARVEAATSGPWYQGQNSRTYETSKEVWTRTHMDDPVSVDVFPVATRAEDAEFVAHAREDVPALLAALAAERERADQAEVALERLSDAHDVHVEMDKTLEYECPQCRHEAK
jgi:hypothetical protein